MRHAILFTLAVAATGCVGEEFEPDIFTGGSAGQAGVAGQAGTGGTAGSSPDAGTDAPTCDAKTVVCGGQCPAGWHLSKWTEVPCGDGGENWHWECTPDCGTFFKCVTTLPCPEGWTSTGTVHLPECGTESPNNALVCEPE